MVRNLRMADGPEEDSVVVPQPRDAILRHHRAALQIALTAPVELRMLEVDLLACRGLVHAGTRRWDDLGSDTVTRNQCDFVRHPLTTSGGMRKRCVEPLDQSAVVSDCSAIGVTSASG